MIKDLLISEKITRVENGLVSALCVKGEPVLKKNLELQMQKLKIPAVSIAVINDGKIEWAKAYGTLSTGQNKLTNVKTRFQAGSVSKPVAAFAILSLVQDKTLDLDEDVNQKLVSWQVPDNEYTVTHKVTLRNLLSHSSGLNVIGFDGYLQNEPVPSITQTLEGLHPANNPPIRVDFIPSSKMSYSGGGYNVAQQLAEDITKIPFANFMQNIVLNPLKMEESTFEHLFMNESTNTAIAHPTNGNPIEGGWKTYPESAAAGLWTTPTDLAKFMIELQNTLTIDKHPSLLNKELAKAIVTPQVGIHGLGPVISENGELLEVSHKGRTDGFTCGFVSFPYLKKGAAVMINSGNDAAFIDDVLRSIAHEYNWPSYAVKVKSTIELPNTTLEQYVGRYGFADKVNDIYDLFILRDGNELFCKIGSASTKHKLYAETENQFFLLDTGYGVLFHKEDNYTTQLTVIVQPGFEREFKKF